jgi:hypothetical protein
MTKRLTLIFVFLGEFGYEVLNWQGKLRKFSVAFPDVQIVIASRKSCEILYKDFANVFIDLDQCDSYINSFADRYFSHKPNFIFLGVFSELFDTVWAVLNRMRVKSFIEGNLGEISGKKKYVFSDQDNLIGGFHFGGARNRINRLLHGYPQSIYHELAVTENQYIDFSTSICRNQPISQVKELSDTLPVCVLQRAERNRIVRSQSTVNEIEIMNELSRHYRLILLDFDSNRNQDTKGVFENSRFEHLTLTSLEDQFRIMKSADICVNFTHGDFRSNNYVPAMVGMVSYCISPIELIDLKTIEFWNQNVFSGEIVPIAYTTPIDVVNKILYHHSSRTR